MFLVPRAVAYVDIVCLALGARVPGTRAGTTPLPFFADTFFTGAGPGIMPYWFTGIAVPVDAASASAAALLAIPPLVDGGRPMERVYYR